MSDDLIKRIKEGCAGRDRWYVMNAAEDGYCMDFDWQLTADQWMAERLRENPDYIKRNGYHIVKQRSFTAAEGLANEAADLIEQQAAKIAELSLDLERTREERNRSQVEARRQIHKEHRDYIAKLEAQIAALTGKVDGWKLVPVEPTSEMILHNSDCSHHAWDDKECPMRAVRFKVWRNMIAAAPAIATVAPAVDAQPVAWRHKATKILRNDSIAKGADFEPADWEPLYTAAQSEGLRKDAEPVWIVNDLGELGVKVGARYFFLYKGENIEYGADAKDGVALHDDGTPMHYRIVGKREFGETCLPISWVANNRSEDRYTVNLTYHPGLSFGKPEDGDWCPLPAALSQHTGEKDD